MGGSGLLRSGHRETAPLSLGQRGLDAGPREPRPTGVRDGARWRVSAERVAHRLLRDGRRRLGMDIERFPTVPGLAPFATRSATGTTLFAARSSAASGAHPMTSTAGRSDASLHIELLRDVAWGLSRAQKELPPKYFYDRRGSELFDEITRLPEYYLTRTERSLLDCWSGALMTALRPAALVELGAGSADKTRLLLDAMVYAESGELYVPIDVSGEFLDDAAAKLREEYPTLGIEPLVGD